MALIKCKYLDIREFSMNYAELDSDSDGINPDWVFYKRKKKRKIKV